ncbi:hypothetical protein ACPOL_4561 [Acidisarcina polymorpha]|uniref:Uncharacterized protein n=1 Tax=Acidisarcina polymorpha TaxID=2211140 RepID=A0A2Z5G3T0_9BACT|nr:hypothetical protein ACPOL_4561 [Acidisarcina polymorpha]
MLWTFLQYLSIRRLGLGKPILLVFLAVLLGCLIAGLIYASVVFHAVTERNRAPHVQRHSTH